MHPSATTRNDTAPLIAKRVRENTTGCGAVATEVARSGRPAARISYPVTFKNAGRTAGGLLPLEEN